MSHLRLAALLLGIGSILGGLVAWPAASAEPPTAHLVKVHVFKPAGFERYGARPVPTTANCSNEKRSTSTNYSFTGWKTEENTANLLIRTLPSISGADSANDVRLAMGGAFKAWAGADPDVPDIAVKEDASNQTRQTADREDDLLFGRTPGSAIAATYTWRWSDEMIESDVVFSSRLPWGIVPSTNDGCNEAAPMYDVENIAAHEFGHVLGLGHASESGDRWNTMFNYGYTGETLKRTLLAPDAAGAAALY